MAAKCLHCRNERQRFNIGRSRTFLNCGHHQVIIETNNCLIWWRWRRGEGVAPYISCIIFISLNQFTGVKRSQLHTVVLLEWIEFFTSQKWLGRNKLPFQNISEWTILIYDTLKAQYLGHAGLFYCQIIFLYNYVII